MVNVFRECFGKATKHTLGKKMQLSCLLVVCHSSRTSVFGWQTFPVLRSTCSWLGDHLCGKLSAI